MAKKNEEPIKNVINQMLNKQGLNDKMQQVKLTELWEDLMGKVVASRTQQIKISKNTLILSVESSALKHQLLISKDQILQRANEALGENKLNELKLL